MHLVACARKLDFSSCCAVDGDGRSELVVGYTDRMVRAFRWEEPSDSSDLGSGQLILLKKWLLEGQVHLTLEQLSGSVEGGTCIQQEVYVDYLNTM